MRLVGLFRGVMRARPAHVAEVKRRCPHCGWVNVFHPLEDNAESGIFQMKQAG
jgi:phage FluMu protein Com